MNVGGYDILRRIGEGAYGKVYLARKGGADGFRTYYALKRLRVEHHGEEFEPYLLREARLGGLVNHPMLVRIHEVLRLDGEYVLVMDYVEGVTLRDVLGRRRGTGEGLDRQVALELGADVLDALHYGHTLRDPEGNASGFVHRDVKPGNIMLTPGGSIKLMDFGVARLDDAPSGTQQGELRGTIAYMAPEQASGEEATPAADQFAAALIVLEMLTGDPAWGDLRGAGILARVVAGNVSEGLAKISIDDPVRPLLERMLAVSPLDRFATAADAARALRELRAVHATPPALPEFVRGEIQWFDDNGGGTAPVPSWSASGGTGGSLGKAAPSAVREVASAPVLPPTPVASPSAPAEERERAMVLNPKWGILPDPDDLSDSELAALAATSEPGVEPPVPPPAGEPPVAPEPFLDGPGEEGTWTGLEALEDPAGVSLRVAMPAPAAPPVGDLERTLPIGSQAAVSAAALAAADLERSPREPATSSTSSPSVPVAWSERTLPFTGLPTNGPDGAPIGSIPGAPVPAAGARVGPPLARLDLPRRAANTLDLAGSPLLSSVIGGLLVCLIFLLAWLVLRDVSEPELDANGDPTPTDAEMLAADDGARRLPPKGILVEDDPPADGTLTEAEIATLDEPTDDGTAPSPDGSVGPDRPVVSDGSAAEPSDEPPLNRRFVEDATAQVAPEEREAVVVVPAPTPSAGTPRPGEIVEEVDELARTPRGVVGRRTTAEMEAAAEEARRAKEEEGPASGHRPMAEVEGGVPDSETASGPALRFLSSREQPISVPLSLRVRPDGFRANSVAVYYQWRGEGSSGRRKRALSAQGDGSYALDISTSELRTDRLQLWFVAEPGAVALAAAGRPIEVRVR